MKDEQFLKDLNRFVGKAGLSTYASGGLETVSERSGFRELEYKEGDWHYRDSYTGFMRSWGTELVRHRDVPVWNALYGGGMESQYRDDPEFAHQTFEFLKKALSAGEKQESFQPRGPKSFRDGDWQYDADWVGDITQFIGDEDILYKQAVVFKHSFMGGLIIS